MAGQGFLIPTVIDPPGRRCVQIWIPDDLIHIANFWGAINSLAYWNSYERTGDDSGARTANVWKGIFLSARERFELGGCEMPIEFRVADGLLEWRPDATAGWVALGDPCPCDADVPAPAYDPDAPSFETRACSLSVGLVNWFMEKFLDTIDAVEAAVDLVTAFDVIIALFNPVAYVITDAVYDVISEIVEATAEAARAFDTVDRREAMQEWLYCATLTTGALTPDIWADFLEWAAGEWESIAYPGYFAWEEFIEMLTVDGVMARARIESYGDHDCTGFNCVETWEHVFDFKSESSLLDWTQYGAYPLPSVSSSGLRATVFTDTAPNPDITRRGVNLVHLLPYADGSTIIQQFEIFTAGFIPASNATVNVRFLEFKTHQDNGTPIQQQTSNFNADDTPKVVGGFTHVGFDTDEAITMQAWVGQRSSNTGQPVNGDVYVEKLIVRGEGKNPFVA